ncbi:hypothetical protein [Microbispora sp. CA-102843]|uniref:hypothetical protein n=1 Tax=Microbispora sp. CA-102843 TaxID=3239952 RepID=UPI003D93E573
MGRYANMNMILFATGVIAGAILGVDAFTTYDPIAEDGTAFLCVLMAAPPVIAAIRVHTQRTQAALATSFEAYASRMEHAVKEHADRTCKHTAERVLEALARAQVTAQLDRAEMRSTWTDTGPFPAVRN